MSNDWANGKLMMSEDDNTRKWDEPIDDGRPLEEL